jgi:hypothetical protein
LVDPGRSVQPGVFFPGTIFFRVRFDRLMPREKDYLRALAALGSGSQRSGEIKDSLGVKAQSVAPLRSGLIKKGMIYRPAHGDTTFTVPLFDAFMLRMMPAEKPPSSTAPPDAST